MMVQIEELRAAIRVTSDRFDSDLIALERAAVDFLETYSGRTFPDDPQPVTERIQGSGKNELWLKELAASSPAIAIVRESYPGDTGAVTLTDTDASTGWVVDGTTITKLLRRGGNAWEPWYDFVVTYTQADSVPARARRFVTGLVAWWHERGIPAPKKGESFVGAAGGSRTTLPLHLESILGSLERMKV